MLSVFDSEIKLVVKNGANCKNLYGSMAENRTR